MSFLLLYEYCTVYDLVSLFLREVNSFLDDLPIRCFGKIHNDWLALQEVDPDAKAELLACVLEQHLRGGKRLHPTASEQEP